MKKILLVTIIIIAGVVPSIAQDLSNKGMDFWLVYPAHIDGNTSRMALYISSNENTSGSVSVNGSTIPFTVSANNATVVQIFPTTYPVINAQNEGVGVGKGIHITSLAPVVVYAHILNAARSGSSLILPTNTLGREYIASSYKGFSNASPPANAINGSNSGSQFTVVAVQDNTTIEVTPTVPDVSGTRTAGVPFTVNLNAGDVYQYRTTFDKDITGSKIRSLSTATAACKPIAVFSGSSWTNMDCVNASGGDNLFQQLMPKNTWGKNYITAPFADRQYDIFRIIVADPTTVITLNGATLPTSSLINNNFYEFKSSTPNVIAADKPVMLVQYMISQTCDTRNTPTNVAYVGDPEMIIVNPIEQTINDVTVVSARRDLTPPITNVSKHFFTIIMKTAHTGSLKIDGSAPTGSFTTIGASGYSYLHENVTNSTLTNASHRIQANDGFIALAYGLGSVESYGYNAGTNVKDLYQYITIKNQDSTIDFPATCRATPFKFAMAFPYEPTELTWKFNGTFTDVVVSNPTFDSTWTINGKQLYRYSLPDTYTIPAIGTYPMKVIAKNPTPDGCNGEQEIPFDLKVYERPVAAFDFNTNNCITEPVSFFDKTNLNGRTDGKWYWDFGDGTKENIKNPVHQFSGKADFDVRFTHSNDIGCVADAVTKKVTLAQLPVAKFNKASLFCEGKEVVFDDASTGTGTPITKWTWDFGDGTPLVIATSNASQKHTYAKTGNFEVKLSVETANGCKSVVYKEQITVNPTPVVDFHLPRVCLPFAAPFKQVSSIADGSEAQFTYQWNFDDGNISSLKDPNHTFTGLGPFNVKLMVTSNKGCSKEITKTVADVYPQPLAAFAMPSESCFNTSVSLTDQSSAGRSTVAEWAWTFSDGTIQKTQNPSKLFATPGEHEVQLAVVSTAGCASAIEKKKIYINELPKSKFTSSAVKCVTKDIQFTDQSTSKDGSIVKWTWDMGDGTVYSKTDALSFNHAFSTAQNFSVKLITETNKGCISEVETQALNVNAIPETDFILPENCLSDPFSQFQNVTTIADGTTAQITYLWNFGDKNATPANPNTSVLKNPSHKYIQATKYDVSLTATSNAGCVVSKTLPLSINGSVPVSEFYIKEGLANCSNNAITLINNSFADVGDIVRLEIFWDASNPASREVDENPTIGKAYIHSYPEFYTPSSKSYTIKVIAYSGQTCLKEALLTIEMKATPQIQFDDIVGTCSNVPAYTITAAKVINGLTGSFAYTGEAINPNGLFNPNKAGTGIHLLRYTFIADNGCVNFKEKSIEVFELPTINAGPDVTMLEGTSTTLKGIGTGNNISYLWNPSNTLHNNKIASPVASPTENTYYMLTITSADGCIVTDQMFVKVLKHIKIPNVFSPNGDGIHDRWEIAYLATYPGATVEIFNRYGQLVFKSQGYDKPWDGTSNSKQLPIGTYYYLINPKNGRGQVSGFVDIIR